MIKLTVYAKCNKLTTKICEQAKMLAAAPETTMTSLYYQLCMTKEDLSKQFRSKGNVALSATIFGEAMDIILSYKIGGAKSIIVMHISNKI